MPRSALKAELLLNVTYGSGTLQDVVLRNTACTGVILKAFVHGQATAGSIWNVAKRALTNLSIISTWCCTLYHS